MPLCTNGGTHEWKEAIFTDPFVFLPGPIITVRDVHKKLMLGLATYSDLVLMIYSDMMYLFIYKSVINY